MEISQNFVAFSEYMNFNKTKVENIHRLLPCYRFDIQLFVGSTINNKYMGRMPLPIGHCPPIEDGLGGQGAAAGHVHAQAVAGPLDSRGGVGILGYS